MEARNEEAAGLTIPDAPPATGLFPQDINIEEIRKAIQGRDDFREVKNADFSSFVYFLGMAKDIFPDPATAPDAETAYHWRLRRECRGIIFSHATGKVLSRRFHKFFNVNETEEVEAGKINLNRPFIILEKLDGSMVFATKNGVTDTSKLVESYVARSDIPYLEYSARWVDKGYSPIYEWCSQKSRVVLDYPEDTLTLISVRHVHTGDYVPFFEMQKHARHHGIPVVTCRTAEEVGVGSITEFEQFQKTIREKNIGLEGFVIRFENGEMYKIKTAWYCDLNKTLDLVSRSRSQHGSEMDVWKVILEEKYDDLRTWLAADDRNAMDHFARDLLKEIGLSCRRLRDTVLEAKRKQGMDKKSFAAYAAAQTSQRPLEKALLFRVWAMYDRDADADAGEVDGEAVEKNEAEAEAKRESEDEDEDDDSKLALIRQEVIETILKNCGKRPLFEKARVLAGNITYKSYIEIYQLSRDKAAKKLDE
ncbi:uncharacterized protein ACA1_096000 [Acanthamoeba castellanii str. Neff]|uniref:T4 RNA ligase 1-like N-terminal domain-containing protein n=1 Tax=Acanthamoeba castellanii (strain ATCC 30010 / Neff) TaxID=1257118 RepID=L8GIM7_ACACF|nr:uncharacterized protein ACA1_096000 [Acanthamoeba castellanii str. Neff]ELR12940.1 hypothetical protein ACA1_096000 [Acanthamoeba castellanii str. Neff]